MMLEGYARSRIIEHMALYPTSNPEEVQQLKHELTDLQKQIQVVSTYLQIQTQENQTTKDKNTKLDSALKSLRAKYNDCKTQVQQQKEELDIKNKEIAELKAKMENSKHTMEAYKDKVKDMVREKVYESLQGDWDL
jgi:chromosome segregation ATPase